ncbi:MAG: Ppx/GppA family phosphatase [Candidatus Aureabacteria bacterium]|nr:Ppx/GppA family phosphatase [Candidatus Auribacterota bacterium]
MIGDRSLIFARISDNQRSAEEIVTGTIFFFRRKKIGFIDVGTNSVRYLAADIPPRGDTILLGRGLSTPRLGEGVSVSGMLQPTAIRRTILALREIADDLAGKGVTDFECVGTEALRAARNACAFLREAAKLGLKIEILLGEEEAELISRGAADDLPVSSSEYILADIGGGSAEIIVRRRGKRAAVASLPLGCVRLQETFGGEDESSRAKIREFCRWKLEEASIPSSRAPLIGLGGTFTTLAAIHRELEIYRGDLVHGIRLSRARVGEILGRLCALPLPRRKKVAGLEPSRADIILPGIAIAEAVMDHLGAPEVTISDRGILFGLLARREETARCERSSRPRPRP